LSALLYHGPGSQETALREAEVPGRSLMAPPFGSEGLKIDEVREIVSVIAAPPVGVDVGTVVLGPMDDARPDAQDVLLKHLEEGDTSLVLPILWARDLGMVMPTIRSRCFDHWCYAESEPELLGQGHELLTSLMEKDRARIIHIVSTSKGDEVKLLEALSHALRSSPDKSRQVWPRVRGLYRHIHPTMMEVMSGLLGVTR